MIGPDEEMRLYRLLEEKLEEISVSLGYFEEPVESEEYRRLEGAWRSYLASVGIRIVPRDYQADEDVYMSSDPLYTTGERLVLSWDLVTKIMVVGLP